MKIEYVNNYNRGVFRFDKVKISNIIRFLFKNGILENNQIILDYCGRSVKFNRKFIKSLYDSEYLEYNKHNYLSNQLALNYINNVANKLDIILLSNVLNAIKFKNDRNKIYLFLKEYKDKYNCKIFISIYNYSKNNKYVENDDFRGQNTKSGWQNCQDITFYENEIKSYFNYEIKDNIIIIF